MHCAWVHEMTLQRAKVGNEKMSPSISIQRINLLSSADWSGIEEDLTFDASESQLISDLASKSSRYRNRATRALSQATSVEVAGNGNARVQESAPLAL